MFFKNFPKAKSLVLPVLVLTLLSFSCNKADQNNKIPTPPKEIKNDYTVAAYVWPSCHHDERFGDMLWPEGEGEWEIIKKATPRFDGHYQPRLPFWGYEMDDDPLVMEKWINVASEHGVNVFIFDWYWFDNGPFLESSLNNGFLKSKNRNKMEFYLMWANHDVKKNYWNVHRYEDDNSILWEGAVDEKNFRIIVDRVINKYFKEPNYFKIEGKPVFAIYSIENLVKTFGSLDKAVEGLKYFREETKKVGFPDLHLQLIVTGNPRKSLLDPIKALKANSVTKYNWGGPHREDYLQWGNQAIKNNSNWKNALNVPYFPNVSIGWDDTPRFPEKGKKNIIHYNKSPQSFATFLEKTKRFCDEQPEHPKIITVFSWNEWIEGGYLLPDMKYGFGYLETLKQVMEGSLEK